jgi:hypothetical protein
MAVISFIVQAPGANAIELITAIIYEFHSKLVSGKLFQSSQTNTLALNKNL